MVWEWGLGTRRFHRLYDPWILVENPCRIVSRLLVGRICDEETCIDDNSNQKHLLSTKYMPSSILRASRLLTHLIIILIILCWNWGSTKWSNCWKWCQRSATLASHQPVWLRSGYRLALAGEGGQGHIPEGSRHQANALNIYSEGAVEGFKSEQWHGQICNEIINVPGPECDNLGEENRRLCGEADPKLGSERNKGLPGRGQWPVEVEVRINMVWNMAVGFTWLMWGRLHKVGTGGEEHRRKGFLSQTKECDLI